MAKKNWTKEQKRVLFDGVKKYGFDWERIAAELRELGYTKSVDTVAKHYFANRYIYKEPLNDAEILARHKPWIKQAVGKRSRTAEPTKS